VGASDDELGNENELKKHALANLSNKIMTVKRA
jgi:hypothetical protein